MALIKNCSLGKVSQKEIMFLCNYPTLVWFLLVISNVQVWTYKQPLRRNENWYHLPKTSNDRHEGSRNIRYKDFADSEVEPSVDIIDSSKTYQSHYDTNDSMFRRFGTYSSNLSPNVQLVQSQYPEINTMSQDNLKYYGKKKESDNYQYVNLPYKSKTHDNSIDTSSPAYKACNVSKILRFSDLKKKEQECIMSELGKADAAGNKEKNKMKQKPSSKNKDPTISSATKRSKGRKKKPNRKSTPKKLTPSDSRKSHAQTDPTIQLNITKSHRQLNPKEKSKKSTVLRNHSNKSNMEKTIKAGQKPRYRYSDYKKALNSLPQKVVKIKTDEVECSHQYSQTVNGLRQTPCSLASNEIDVDLKEYAALLPLSFWFNTDY
ncbi:uncharacterized protein LOC105697141 isoform X1 [Orussus abietinus]|uniref:uncharacterized protein LOC105697141 isoform X1 n=1 Tax=Orussus abietinus TaxID=222816 RepID=UPI00062620DF|nr:uncharacterized protein LOC105697141 isoform X1 [Orussus abietinus]XP_012275619.1 uncharacterized protein LOC105697141 isoform X1 [Orussus abietinus]XP_012275620.1 uncharacterized protein LOC105697141 isoform X1 [Orussus abietinus]